jgi:iron complex transport system permease protein
MAERHSSSGRETHARKRWASGQLVAFCLACTAVTVVAGVVQVSNGVFETTVGEAWAAVFDPNVLFNPDAWNAFLLDGDLPEMSRTSLVVWQLRIPRVFVGIVAGATLAVSGAIFQAITRNELASPFVLGVSSGAGFAVLAGLVLFSGLRPFLPFLAALGGATAFVLVYAIAWHGGTSPVRLVLAGVIVNMIFYSLQQGIFFLASDVTVVKSALAWTTGSLTNVGWEEVRLALLPGALALGIAVVSARQLNVLALGERTAKSLGMRVERMRFGLAAVAILAASVAIAVAGIVSFFGLVVPHVVRNVVGSDYRRVVVGCLFAGPALMVVADVGARLALGGPQVPVGVVTGVVGGPYFLYLMRRQRTMGQL